jgi:hypothetical protein
MIFLIRQPGQIWSKIVKQIINWNEWSIRWRLVCLNVTQMDYMDIDIWLTTSEHLTKSARIDAISILLVHKGTSIP